MCIYISRSRESDVPQSGGSRERDFPRSDDRRDRERPNRDDRKDREGPGDRNGDYNGPPGMLPEGIIEVLFLYNFSLFNLNYLLYHVFFTNLNRLVVKSNFHKLYLIKKIGI